MTRMDAELEAEYASDTVARGREFLPSQVLSIINLITVIVSRVIYDPEGANLLELKVNAHV